MQRGLLTQLQILSLAPYPACLVALLLIPSLTLRLSWARLRIGSMTVTVVARFLQIHRPPGAMTLSD
jgi:hypothetical protein